MRPPGRKAGRSLPDAEADMQAALEHMPEAPALT
jgi:hypothetical protein